MEKCYVPRAFLPSVKRLKNTPVSLSFFPICRNNKILLKQIYKRFGVSVSLGLPDRLGGWLLVFVFSARLGVVLITNTATASSAFYILLSKTTILYYVNIFYL